MNGKNINFDDKRINSIDYIDINKISVSRNESYGTKNSFKYFIGYNDNDVIRPLCIRLPQMTVNTRKIDKNATMSFRVSNKQFLKNYNKI